MNALKKGIDWQQDFYIQNKSLRNTADIVWGKKLQGNAQLTTKFSTSFFNRTVTTNSFGMKGNQTAWYREIAYSNKWNQHNFVAGINFNGDQFNKKLPDSTLIPSEKKQYHWHFCTRRLEIK